MAKAISTLTQRRFGERREYVLLADRLQISEWTPFEASEYAVALDTVPTESLRAAAASKTRFALAVAATVAALAVLLWAAVDRSPLPLAAAAGAVAAAGGAWWAFALGRRSWVVLTDGETGLYFFADRPNADAVEAFLGDVRRQRERHLRENRAARQQEGSMVDDLERLTWLREQGYLTDEEYGALKRRLVDPAGPVQATGPVN